MAIEPLGRSITTQTQSLQKAEATKIVIEGKDSPNQETIKSENSPVIMARPDGKNDFVESDYKDSQNNYDQQGKEQQSISKEQMKQAVDKINKNVANSEVQFGIHEATNRITIKIIDRTTKEVIKELPPEKTLDMIAKAWELAGILVDEKR